MSPSAARRSTSPKLLNLQVFSSAAPSTLADDMSNNEPEKKNDAVEEDYGIPSPQQPWTVGKVFGMVKQASQRVVIATKDIDEKYQVFPHLIECLARNQILLSSFSELCSLVNLWIYPRNSLFCLSNPLSYFDNPGIGEDDASRGFNRQGDKRFRRETFGQFNNNIEFVVGSTFCCCAEANLTFPLSIHCPIYVAVIAVYQVTAKTKEALASTGNAIKDFDQKNQITTKTKQGVQQGASYVFGSGKGGGSGGPGGQTGP